MKETHEGYAVGRLVDRELDEIRPGPDKKSRQAKIVKGGEALREIGIGYDPR